MALEWKKSVGLGPWKSPVVKFVTLAYEDLLSVSSGLQTAYLMMCVEEARGQVIGSSRAESRAGGGILRSQTTLPRLSYDLECSFPLGYVSSLPGLLFPNSGPLFLL